MEKLIELLNEWYLEKYGTNPNFVRFEDYGCNDYWYFIWDDKLMVETEVWTKKYWFIKWLVDNDKINFHLVKRVWSWDFVYDMTGNPYYNSCFCEDLEEYGDVDRVLMLLAIQDEPLTFLISILR